MSKYCLGMRRETSSVIAGALSSRSGVTYEPYSEQQRFALTQQLQSYLESGTGELPIESVRQMHELLDAARGLWAKKEAELSEAKANAASGLAPGGGRRL